MTQELSELLQRHGWTKTDADSSITLKSQLSREISPDHQLFPEMESFTVIAKATKNDDILISDDARRLVIVHLTWQNAPSNSSDFPETVCFSGFEQLKIWLGADH